MKATYILEKFDQKREKPENCKFISYSQYSTFQKCQHLWKLKYIDKIKEQEPSIHMTFGTSMHNIVQHWLQVLFTKTVKESEAIDFDKLLMEELKKNYAEDVKKHGKHFSTKEQLSEFYLDGLETLKYLRKKRTKYFDRRNQELVGTEVPILIAPIPEKPNVVLMGFLDIVLKDKKGSKFYIPDLKTSTKGWNQWDKKDQTKIDQLLIYKIYFAQQYNIPIEEIEVEYMILKRKIDLDSMYPQKRVQTFNPSQGKVSLNKTLKSFESFINSCFLPDGSYNTLFPYQAIAGKNEFNCRFCEFKNDEKRCDPRDRKYE
jgi:hypothetical protein